MSGNTGHPFAIGGPQVRVKVTEHDIEWAVRDDSSRCMVARALAREVVDANRIEVDTQTIRFSNSKGRFAYLTPLTVQRYVAAFDAGDPVQPFDFTLRNPMRLKQRILTPEEKAENRLRQLTEDTRTDPGLPSGVRRVGRDKRPRKTATSYTTPGDTGSPPRVFKTKKRTYGARLLRINQPMQATALDERSA